MTYWKQEQLERIYSAAQEERFVVFMGSGVSASSGLPDWSGLIERLLGILDNPSVYAKGLKPGITSVCLTNPLQGLDYLYGMDKQAFVEKFREMFPTNRDGYKPTDEGAFLSRLNTKRFMTINYDFCFQHSFAKTWKTEKLEESIDGVPETGVFDALKKPTLYQLHGCAANKVSELVLMDSQYDGAYAAGSRLVGFLEHLLANYLVLFVGFGFQDKDLLRVMARSVRKAEDSWKYKHVGIFGRSRNKNLSEGFGDFARRMWNTEVVFYEMKIVSGKRNHGEIIPMLGELLEGISLKKQPPPVAMEDVAESISTPPIGA